MLKIGKLQKRPRPHFPIPDQLKDTTMHPDIRRLLQVQIPEGADDETRDIFVKLMGKGEAAARRAWMEREGDTAELDI